MRRTRVVAPARELNGRSLVPARQAPGTAALAMALAALLLFLTPVAAEAAFRATAASSVTVGTYVIPAPASATFNFSGCVRGKNGRYTLNLTSYANVARADSYLVSITAPDGTTATQTITANTFSFTKASTKSGTYTFTIQALVKTWIGAPFRGSSNTC